MSNEAVAVPKDARKARRGAVIFLTGLSGSGKTTIAQALHRRLLAISDYSVSILDGDVARTHLSKELGFSKEDRNTNVERIGFVACEIAKHGGIAICAVIAPYREAREKNRRVISEFGTYIEVFVDTPLAVCEARDVKGLYKKARQGLLKQFTGIDDVYEIPENPEVTITTTTLSPEDAVDRIVAALEAKVL